jgi:hypothetical protein
MQQFITNISERDTWNFQSTAYFNVIWVDGLSGFDGAIYLNGQNVYGMLSGSSFLISELQGLSGNWQDTYSIVQQNSADWVSTFTTVKTLSDFWGSELSPLTGNWESTYTTVFNNSASWEESTDITYLSAAIDRNTANLTAVSLVSSNWDAAYTNITTNSAAYLTAVDISLLAAASGNWNSTQTTVHNNSSNWSYAYTNQPNYAPLSGANFYGNITALNLSGVNTGDQTFRLDDLTNVSISNPIVDEMLRYNGTKWANGQQSTASPGPGITFYLNEDDVISAGIGPQTISLQTLSKTPQGGPEEKDSVTCINEYKLIDQSMYNAPLNTTTIDAGVWTFNYFCDVDVLSGNNLILTSLHKVISETGSIELSGSGVSRLATTTNSSFISNDGNIFPPYQSRILTPNAIFNVTDFISESSVMIECLSTYTNEVGVGYSIGRFLFSVNSPYLHNDTVELKSVNSFQPAYIINFTDRLLASYYGMSQNLDLTPTTISLYHNGTEHYSNFITPLVIRHNDLPGLQGGSGDERNHLTNEEYANVGNLTGVNTGDQDLSGLLKRDQTTPQTTVGAFNFPIVRAGTQTDDGNHTPAQVVGLHYTCPDISNAISTPTYSETYNLDGVYDNSCYSDEADGSFLNEIFDIQVWSYATASDSTRVFTPNYMSSYVQGYAGSVLNISLFAGGAGYSVGEQLSLQNGNYGAFVTVDSVDEVYGKILDFGPIDFGTGYEVGEYITIDGGNSDAQLQVDSIDGTAGVIENGSTGTSAGSGYAVDEIITIISGNSDAQIKVDSIDVDGVVTTWSWVNYGTGYSTGTDNTTTASISGLGFLFNVDSVYLGTVTSASTVSFGSGYSVGYASTTASGNGSGFSIGISTVGAGSVTSVSIYSAGSLYTEGVCDTYSSYSGTGCQVNIDVVSRFQLQLNWGDYGGNVATEGYVVQIYSYSTGQYYWLDVGNVDTYIVGNFSGWAAEGANVNPQTPYYVQTGNLIGDQAWTVYAKKITAGVAVYSAIPYQVTDSDPSGYGWKTTLSWDDATADGYLIQNTTSNYYIELDSSTLSIEDNGDYTYWISGTLQIVTPYYQDLAHLYNSTYDVKIKGNGQIITNCPDGTKPLSVVSTTLNDNLNADLLDGQHASAFQSAGTYVNSVGATLPLSSTGGVNPVISHSTLAGYKHIPSGGIVNQLAKTDANGSLTYSTITDNNGALSGVNTIKFTSGPLITIPETGSIEFLGDKFYGTGTSDSTTFGSRYPSPTIDLTTVKVTQRSGPSVEGYLATDPTKSLIGSNNFNSWIAPDNPQRFHIDLGGTKIVKKIYYENYHNSGANTIAGVRNFTFWGSNDVNSFNETTYSVDTGWTQLTTNVAEFDQHVAANTVDPKYITVTNTTPYRYYGFKFADNWSSMISTGVRRIELQELNKVRSEFVQSEVAGYTHPNKVVLMDINGDSFEVYLRSGILTID